MTLRRLSVKQVNEAGSSGERPNTVGLSERLLAKVLDAMDQHDAQGGGSANRVHSRWPFREETIPVTLVHPGGTEVTLRLAARNLSKGGIGLLHSAFTYPDTLCTVSLPRSDGSVMHLPGRVRRCVHLRGVVHELGIVFDEEIDPREIVSQDVMESRLSYEKVDAHTIEGVVCVAEPLAGDFQIIRRALRRTVAETVEAKTGAEALEAARKGARVILTSFDLGDMTGGELASAVRDAGLGTPVIVTGTESAHRIRRGLNGHPVAAFLPKPLTEEVIHRALAEFCSTAEAAEDAGGGMDAQRVFREQSATTAVQLERAADKDDAMQVYTVAERLMETAPKLGFRDIGAIASTVAEKLSVSLDVSESRAEIDDLIAQCRALGEAA